MDLTAQLYIVATPIGNLGDMSERAIAILKAVDVILCEDTRNAKPMLQNYGILTNLQSYHAHNNKMIIPSLINAMVRDQKTYALISDAGMPAISDPGALLVAACADHAIDVTCVPGPSAVLSAYALSGFANTAFQFLGFLPTKGQARQKMLHAFLQSQIPSVFFESPQRLVATLNAINATDLSNRQIVVAKELTKKFEKVWRGRAIDILQDIEKGEALIKGEFVIVVDQAAPMNRLETLPPSLPIDVQQLATLLKAEGLKTKTIANLVATSTEEKIKKQAIYDAIA